jgi:NAD+ kinase
MKALLVVNPQKAASQTLAVEIKDRLQKEGISAAISSYTDKPGSQHGGFDIAFSLGGDGTVLFTARIAAPFGIPILPLNLGSLGFLAAVHPNEWRETFEKWRSGALVVSERIMLDISVERGGGRVFSMCALNDAVISASGIAKTIRLRASSREYNLARYRSDGLIAATPTGSSAYSASAGGPILDPEMEAFILNPICPFTLLHRPLVTPACDDIKVLVEQDQRSGVLLTIDGQVTEALENGDLVRIGKAPYKTKLLACDKNSFYQALHSKLAWTPG